MSLSFLKKLPIKKYLPEILLVVIVIVGLGFRLFRLSDLLWAQRGFDDQRDMLVSRHIVDFGETIGRGPLAGGGFNLIKNSPYYYYLTAFLWFVSGGTPFSFSVTCLLLVSFVIPLSYLVGKQLWDKKTGLIAAAFFSLNQELIFESRHFTQPYLIPLFTLSLFWILTWKPSIKSVCLALCCLFIPLHFHYSILLFFPVGLWWILHVWLVIFDEGKTNKKQLALPFLVGIILGLIWIFSTYTRFPFDQIYFFVFNFTGSKGHFILNVQNSASLLFKLLWSQVNLLKEAISVILLALTLFWPKVLRDQKSQRNFWIFNSFLISYLLSIFFGGNLLQSYVSGFVPFLLIGIAVGLRIIILKNRFVGYLLTGVLLIALTQTSKNALYFDLPATSYYEKSRQATNAIYQDYNLNHIQLNNDNLEDFGVVTLVTGNPQPFDGWGTSGIWFLLEQKFKHPLVKLSDWGVNSYPLASNPTFLYMVCDHRTNPELIEKECLNRFTGVRDYLLPNEKKIWETADVTVWRFETTLKLKNRLSYFHVYNELLPK